MYLKKQGYLTTTYTFSPGTQFPYHSHDVNKKDSIVSGQFLFGMQGDEVRPSPYLLLAFLSFIFQWFDLGNKVAEAEERKLATFGIFILDELRLQGCR